MPYRPVHAKEDQDNSQASMKYTMTMAWLCGLMAMINIILVIATLVRSGDAIMLLRFFTAILMTAATTIWYTRLQELSDKERKGSN